MEKNQIFALVINIFLLVFVIYSIKKGRLKEKYAILWVISSISLIVFSVWFTPIRYLAFIIGIADPLNLLYLLGGFYLILIMLHFSFTLSKLHDNYKILTQNLALLEEKGSKELAKKQDKEGLQKKVSR